MAKITGAASLGMRLGVAHKKGYGSHDGITPYHEIRIERDVSEDLTDEQLGEKAEQLRAIARKIVEKRIAEDRADLQQVD